MEALDEPSGREAPRRLLLIEDSRMDARLVRQMLTKSAERYEVTHKGGIAAAVQECGKQPFDLIVLDLFLEDSSGLDTFHACRKVWPDVPIVVLSGTEDETTAKLAVAAGAQDYLVKGEINAGALCRVLQYSLSRHRAAEERRALVQELEQSRRLEAIGQLAAGVAHEINTPTQFVSDNTHFLREAFEDVAKLLRGLNEDIAAGRSPDVEALRQRLQEADVDYLLEELPRAIQQSLDGLSHIARIVRAMKEFSHPASAEKNPVDLNHALQTTVLVAKNEWKYVAEVETDLAPDLPQVECLAGEMNQVFLNLLVNAAHAVGDAVRDEPGSKGRIMIRTRTCGPDAVEVRIEDSGCGILPEHRHRIFEQFFTTKEVGKGTGQGLAIARHVVVNKHAGSLEFESEVGRGTTFVIRLPCRTAQSGVERDAA